MRVDILNKNEVQAISDRLSADTLILWELGCSTGLRISDLLSLSVNQIKGKKRITLTEQKTGKSRRIYINDKLYNMIDNYIKRHKLKDTDKLFRASYITYYRRIKKASREITEKNVGSHSMRKSYAYDKLVNKGYDLYTLQHCLNHTLITDTINYTLSNEVLKKKNGKNNKHKK